MNERDASSGVPRTEENIGGSNVKQKIQFGHRHFIFVKYCEVFRRLHTLLGKAFRHNISKRGDVSARIYDESVKYKTKRKNQNTNKKTKNQVNVPKFVKTSGRFVSFVLFSLRKQEKAARFGRNSRAFIDKTRDRCHNDHDGIRAPASSRRQAKEGKNQ